jgi:hypothetical protein
MAYSEISKIAANWWAKNIKSPTFDNGDESKNGFMMSLMMKSLVKEVTEDQLDKFKSKLAEYIENELNKKSYNISIGVDYHPCKTLYDIAELCEISVDNFPIKTNMTINRTCILSSLGYGGRYEVLYSTVEYWVKELESLNISLENYKNKECYIWLNDDERKDGIKRTLIDIEECKNKINSYKE